MEYDIKPYPAHDLELKWEKKDIITFCDDQKSIILIGYRVSLTPYEYKIVKLLFDEETGVSVDTIVEKCFKNKDVTYGNVAVHVHNINQKVMPITNRKLVVGDRKQGYKITESV